MRSVTASLDANDRDPPQLPLTCAPTYSDRKQHYATVWRVLDVREQVASQTIIHQFPNNEYQTRRPRPRISPVLLR